MKKQLFMTTAAATALLGLGGCSSNDDWGDDTIAEQDTAVCVDQNGTRVDDSQCQTASYHSGYHGGGNGFLWYYLGRNSTLPYYGESVRDPRYAHGSYSPRAGAKYAYAPPQSRMTRSQAISRGGLGRSGHSFGGGRS